MPNSIKYSTTTQTGSLQKGNVALGVNGSFGPTSTTGWYSNITPQAGKYSIIETSVSNNPLVYCPQNDDELIRFVRLKGATGVNTGSAAAALAWISTQSSLMATNIEYESIVTDGLLLNLDAGFVGSYPTTGTTWYDLTSNNYNVTLINSPSFNSDGFISFNGTDQRGEQSGLPSVDLSTDYYTIELWFKQVSLPTAGIDLAGDNGGPLYGARLGGDYQLFVYAASSDQSNLGVSYDDSRNNANHRTEKSIVTNEWVQFVHVGIPYVEGPYNRGKFKYYVNGVLDHDETISSDSNGYSIPTTFYVAYDARFGDYGEVDMSIIRRYDRELSAEEVLQNYNATKDRFGL